MYRPHRDSPGELESDTKGMARFRRHQSLIVAAREIFVAAFAVPVHFYTHLHTGALERRQLRIVKSSNGCRSDLFAIWGVGPPQLLQIESAYGKCQRNQWVAPVVLRA